MAEHATPPNGPALLRTHEGAIYDLAHIVELLRVVTDMAGPLCKETVGALNFLAYLAADRVGTLGNALGGAPNVD